MKKLNYFTNSRKAFFFFIIFAILFSVNIYSQSKISPSVKCKQIGLVWGLLKYHHPEISNGDYNWDLEFVKLFDKAEALGNQTEMNNLLSDFISKYESDNIKKKRISSERVFQKNMDYNWIDPSVYGDKLTRSLMEIKDNGNINNYYASTDKLAKMLSFKNETGFKDFNYSIKSHRMLLLYSFWNVIQYWNVNKYLMDTKWIDNLDSMTEEFINCKTNLEFELVKSKLISKLNDSHSYYCSAVVNDSLFKYKPIFAVKAINDSLVINSISDKVLAKKDDIELGDIIVKINNKSISTCLNEKIVPIISASNSNSLKKWSTWLFYYDKDSINVDIIKKDGIKRNKYLHLYKNSVYQQPISLEIPKKDKWYFIKEDIAYVDLGKVTKKELSDMFKHITTTKGLIIDLRNHPKNMLNSDIAEYLYPKRKEFIKVLFPIENNPSFGEYDGEVPLKLVSDPFKAGSNNPDYYKGKVILLVNRRTQSKDEYIGMTIQQSPTCITIGEQTAGAVMNIVNYIMPDKTQVSFTGLGAFYPNGESAQRNGLHIDYYVNETAKNYDPELYIKEAIKIIDDKN